MTFEGDKRANWTWYAKGLLLLFVMAMTGLAAAQPAKGDKADPPESTSSTEGAKEEAPPPEPIAEELARIGERVQTLDEEISAIEAGIDPAVQPPAPNPRLEFLRRSKLLNQRRISALTRIQQLTEQLAPPPTPEPIEEAKAEPKSRGEKTEPEPVEPEVEPIDVKAFDTLLDQLDAAPRQLTAKQEAVTSQKQAAQRARQNFEDAGRARRAAEETHAKAVAAGGGTTEFEQLEASRFAESLAESQVKVEDALVQVAELEVRLAERDIATARETISEASSRLIFTKEALEEITAALTTQRDELTARLNELYKQREKESDQLFRERQNATNAAPESADLAKERVTTVETVLGVTNEGIQNLEERIANINYELESWENRLALNTNQFEGSLIELQRETTQKLAVLHDSLAQAESRARNNLSSRLEIDRRMTAVDLSEDLRNTLKRRSEALDRIGNHDRDFIADLTRQEKLLRRLDWSLTRQIETTGFMAQFVEARRIALMVWNYELFVYDERGFTVSTLAYAFIVYASLLTALLWLRRILRKRLVKFLAKRAGADNAALRDAGLTFINGSSTLVMVILSLWPTLRFLPLSETAHTVLTNLIYLAILYQVALYATNWMERTLNRHKMRRMKEDPSSVSAYGVMSFFARIAVWTVLLLFALDSFGVDITTVVAGLGVGGIAVAFALQSILADIFSSVAILLDKPFAVGDFVKVGTELGEVESIGLKTTRVKSLSGEQLIISNTDLLGSRIQNYKRMQERRVKFNLGVTYQTTAEQLEAIPPMIRAAIESHEKARFDRCHFSSYGDFALIFETVYYVLSNDYVVYMDIQQAVNIRLFREFAELGIEFAYPTQTLYVHMAGAEGPAQVITARETGEVPKE